MDTFGHENFGLTTGGIQPPTTSFAFEVFRFLMIDEDFEIVEVSFAVITPRPRQNLLDVGMMALLLGHSEYSTGKESKMAIKHTAPCEGGVCKKVEQR